MRPSTRTRSTSASATAGRRSPSASSRESERRAEKGGSGLNVPVIMPRLSIRHLHIPTFGLGEMGGGAVAAAGRSMSGRMPSRERLGYYAGLGALAAIGVIEWPVAAAIGVGVAVAKRTSGDGARRPSTRSVETRPRAAAEPKGGETG